MAIPQSTTTWNSLFSTTLNAVEEKVFDNIFKDNPLLTKLLEADKVETEDGGARLQRALEYAQGGNFQRVHGYSEIDLTPTEIITAAFDDWREAVTVVSISRREERSNSGRHQIVNLLTAKMNNAAKDFRDGIAKDLLAPDGANQTAGSGANGALAVNPLIQIAPIIRSGALENTVLHSIDPATQPWWKPSARTKSGSSNNQAWTYAKYKNEIRHTINSIQADGGSFPNFALGTQDAWEKYVESLDDKVRYTSTEKGDMGFRTVVLDGLEFMWDRRMYGTDANAQNTVNFDNGKVEEVIAFFNLDYMYLIFDSESKFKSLGFREAQNQLARSAIVVCMFQLMTTNRRAHGALYGIDVSAIVA